MASKPKERPHLCGDHLYYVPRKWHRIKLLGPHVLEPRGRLSMCGPFLITPSRRKTGFGMNFECARHGSKPQHMVHCHGRCVCLGIHPAQVTSLTQPVFALRLGYNLPTRTKKILVEHKPGSLPKTDVAQRVWAIARRA